MRNEKKFTSLGGILIWMVLFENEDDSNRILPSGNLKSNTSLTELLKCTQHKINQHHYDCHTMEPNTLRATSMSLVTMSVKLAQAGHRFPDC